MSIQPCCRWRGVRWTKLIRDFKQERGRIALMLGAIGVSIAAIGAVLGAYAILTQQIAANYEGTNPAAATIELEGDVDASLLALARQHPQVLTAEARDVLHARAKVGADWCPMLLFVSDSFSSTHLNTFKSVTGAWPTGTGGMLIERTATSVLDANVGKKVTIRSARGATHELPIEGLVHDPGLAPAWQEHTGYGYITRETLSSLGESSTLHELRFTLRDHQASIQQIESVATDLVRTLSAQGHVVQEVRVPPPRQHPHQRQMVTMLLMMLVFSGMALVLSSILVSSSLQSMLARQLREIGVMKTIGASNTQIFAMYMIMIALVGTIAVSLAMPLGWFGSHLLANAVAGLLNFSVAGCTAPGWVFVVQAFAGILVPLLVAALPIVRTSRKSVRQAIDQYGASTENLRERTTKLPWPVRNALRRPARLALTVVLLSAGGGMFMTALNVSGGWQRNIAKVLETRRYDVEVRFFEPQPAAVARQLRTLPDVGDVEGWGYSPASLDRPGQINIVRTYPDRSHATFTLVGPPSTTRFVEFSVLAGRWLNADDADGVVMNVAAAAQLPQARVGDRVKLSANGRSSTWRLLGVVEEVGSPGGVAYVSEKAFEQAVGRSGHRMFRIAFNTDSPQRRITAIRAIEQRLSDDGIGIEAVVPLSELHSAVSDHLAVLTRSLVVMAVVMATVGALGMASAMGVSVLERTREFAVMKTVGATPQHITRLLIAEALFIAFLSWLAAATLAIPLTVALNALVGKLGFVAPPPFVMSLPATLGWLLLVVAISAMATWIPARRASRSSVAHALGWQ